MERDITGTQIWGFKTFEQLQLQERDKLKIDQITKTECKEYYGKLWNEQGSKGEVESEEERRSEGTDENEDMITIEELNEILKQAKDRKSCRSLAIFSCLTLLNISNSRNCTSWGLNWLNVLTALGSLLFLFTPWKTAPVAPSPKTFLVHQT